MTHSPVNRSLHGQAAVLAAAAIGAGLVAGCGTPLANVPPQPTVLALPPTPAGVLADVTAATRETFGPDASGFLLIPRNRDALTWRLALVEHATASLDAMYFIWQKDLSGILLLDRIIAAADRGVRVRLIVDDLPLASTDRNLAALCLHPNIDLKIFNPVGVRKGGRSSMMEFLVGLRHYNRRMHNKLLVADNHLAIAGGRNIGDAYFGLSQEYNFRDLDVLVSGQVVTELSDSFDVYWNSEAAYPARYLSSRARDRHLEWIRNNQNRYLGKHKETIDAYSIEPAAWEKTFRDLAARMVAGNAQVVQDEPIAIDGEAVRVVDIIEHLTADTPAKHEVLISSPYMIPTGSFLDDLREATGEGVEVKIITGSLGSNNHTPAHAFYRKYRTRILKTGAQVYEFHHEPSPEIRDEVDTPPVRAQFVSMHTKAFVGDRDRCFIGSLNLDPRAVELNTENGLYIESPALGDQVASIINAAMGPSNAWAVTMDENGKLTWTSDLGVRHREPARNGWQRVKAFFFRLLPIEKQI